jgi:CheY-like chemotaxis protein
MTRKVKGLEALFGPRQAILFCTYLEPWRWWTQAELAGQCSTVAAVADELAVLCGGDVLRTRGDGAAAEYQANSEGPYFAEIQAMMAKAATRDTQAGLEAILVVDDQPATLKVTRILLESFGYEVLPAGNGQEAMILYRHHQERIRLLLTDVVMPDITGPQLAQRLLRIDPNLRVIYMSAYPQEELRGGGMVFLAKPFNPAGLSKAVREALDTGLRDGL